MSVEHVEEHMGWQCSDAAMNNRLQLSPKQQTSERTSGTICAVVERPDHQCDDDLVRQLATCLNPHSTANSKMPTTL